MNKLPYIESGILFCNMLFVDIPDCVEPKEEHNFYDIVAIDLENISYFYNMTNREGTTKLVSVDGDFFVVQITFNDFSKMFLDWKKTKNKMAFNISGN